MREGYLYLQKYIGHNDLRGIYFLPVKEEEIIKAEEKMGKPFPAELRNFYQKVGTGILSCGEHYPEMHIRSVVNEILPPRIVVDYMQGILEHPEGDAYYMSYDTYEDLLPDDLPFFEIADGSSFMTMKLDSDNPNAVWYMGAEKIEDSFEKFIWRLYYEGPNYYTQNW